MKDNKVLLVRRAIDPGKGLWTNPGGYIEQHEPIEQTVVREVLEESGVSAMVKEVVAIRDLPRDIHNLYVAFSMEYIEGEPCPDGMEVDAAGFFSLQEIEHMNVAGFTRWLVDVAFHGKNQGLIVDQNPIVPLTGYSLFRVSTHL
ncbi:NUDIX domain-containing protein [Fodinisporobacter ferrooxydans]|uniref:NUDIX domain-containing protein n=1 Tax=Fodinisporobacter ferrooxydans TaxID=2901836 RepID=A0ABY4CIW2_9BACL|nr:NUDIX domain-containing protein [Alicyclobacillaceae bacterium MYW30-H2]